MSAAMSSHAAFALRLPLNGVIAASKGRSISLFVYRKPIYAIFFIPKARDTTTRRVAMYLLYGEARGYLFR